MSLFRHHRDDHDRDHRHRDPWDGAPPWDRELGRMQAIIIAQNEEILAALKARPNKLSPEDQKIANELFERATATAVKTDAAVKS